MSKRHRQPHMRENSVLIGKDHVSVDDGGELYEQLTDPNPPKEMPMVANAENLKPDAMAKQDPGGTLVPRGVRMTSEKWAALDPQKQADLARLYQEENSNWSEGIQVNFPRITYPTSGSSFWAVPTAEGEPEARKTLEAVIVFRQPVRAYWPLNEEVGNNPPTCSSFDAKKPVEGPGKQAKTCVACPHSQWGSGREGRGQACKARLQCFLIFEGEQIPTLLSLPPSALSIFSEYVTQLRKDGIPPLSVTTIFGLADAKSKGGISYKGLTLKIGSDVDPDRMLALKEIRDEFEDQMRRRGIEVEEVEETNGHSAIIDTEGRVIDGSERAY